MPVEIRRGDLFDSGAAGLVCPVNCFGVMGAGLAVPFFRRFPVESSAYKERCKARLLRPGGVFSAGREPVVLFAATKDHWSKASRVEWVVECSRGIRFEAARLGLASVATPALGCGRGGLPWDDVRPLMEKELLKFQGLAYIYEPPSFFP